MFSILVVPLNTIPSLSCLHKDAAGLMSAADSQLIPGHVVDDICREGVVVHRLVVSEEKLLSFKAEFSKDAILQSHDCAKYLRTCKLNNTKQGNLALISYIFYNFMKFLNLFIILGDF